MAEEHFGFSPPAVVQQGDRPLLIIPIANASSGEGQVVESSFGKGPARISHSPLITFPDRPRFRLSFEENGRTAKIFEIGLTTQSENTADFGTVSPSIHSVTLTLSDLTIPTGLEDLPFSTLNLYRSVDNELDEGDMLIGTTTEVNVGSPTTVRAWRADVPPAGVEHFYLVEAELGDFPLGRAFRVGFEDGGVNTSVDDAGVGTGFPPRDDAYIMSNTRPQPIHLPDVPTILGVGHKAFVPLRFPSWRSENLQEPGMFWDPDHRDQLEDWGSKPDGPQPISYAAQSSDESVATVEIVEHDGQGFSVGEFQALLKRLEIVPVGEGNATIAVTATDDLGADSTATFSIEVRRPEAPRDAEPPAGTVFKIAGTNQLGSFGDGGPALDAGIGGTSRRLAVDAAGSVYLTDDHRIRKIDAGTGIITTVAGNGSDGFSGDGGLAIDASLGGRLDVAVDAAGNIYIADEDNARVRRVDAVSGLISTVAGGGLLNDPDAAEDQPATETSIRPAAIELDSDGNLYIAEFSNNRVFRVDAASNRISTVVGLPLGYNGPTYFSGNYGFYGLLNGVFQLFRTGNLFYDGDPNSTVLAGVSDVAVDAAGNLYVLQTLIPRVLMVDVVTGLISTVVGREPEEPGGNTDLAVNAVLGGGWFDVDAVGNLYIADNLRILRIEATTGLIETFAGASQDALEPTVEGTSAADTRIVPLGIAVGGNGENVYVFGAGQNILRIADEPPVPVDPDDETAVNNPPVVSAPIPDRTLPFGGPQLDLNLLASPAVFRDPDSDPLSFTARSLVPGVVAAGVDGNVLILIPISIGTSTIEVTARDGTENGEVTTSFRVEVAPNTPAGSDVSFVPSDPDSGPSPVTLQFSSVTAAGETRLGISGNGPTPLPHGFKHGTPPTYYHLTTTATVDGPVDICIDYNDVVYADETTLRLFNFEAEMTDITTSLDTVDNQICGVTNALEFFAVLEVDASINVFPVLANPIAGQTLVAGGASFVLDLDAQPAVFFDANNDVLSYRASITNGVVLDATVAGSVLTVTPKAAGNALVFVVVDDGRGGVVQINFSVTVGEAPPPVATAVDYNMDQVIDEADFEALSRSYGGRPGDPFFDLDGNDRLDTVETLRVRRQLRKRCNRCRNPGAVGTRSRPVRQRRGEHLPELSFGVEWVGSKPTGFASDRRPQPGGGETGQGGNRDRSMVGFQPDLHRANAQSGPSLHPRYRAGEHAAGSRRCLLRQSD